MKNVVMCIMDAKTKKARSAQEKVIRGYCEKHEMNVIDTILIAMGEVGELVFDNWMTGRRVDAVVVANAFNVSTNIYEFFAYKSVLRRRHSDLIAVNMPYGPGIDDWAFSTGEKLTALIDEICRIEMENKPVNMHDRIDRAARGKYIGGNPPMGYKIEDGALVVNEAEVPVVLLVMQRKHEGKSKLSTVDALNQNGYKTRNGKPFVISTVQSIWNNEEFYRGYRRDKNEGKWVKGEHKAILEW